MGEQDFIDSLGLAFLAHQLKRASELILEASASVMRSEGIKRPSGSASTLLLLDRLGPLTVTEIGFHLRVSHPFAIRITDGLARNGLVRSGLDRRDARRRPIRLTDAGRCEVANLQRYCRALVALFEEVTAESGLDLFDAVMAFNSAAERAPLPGRLARLLEQQTMEEQSR